MRLSLLREGTRLRETFLKGAKRSEHYAFKKGREYPLKEKQEDLYKQERLIPLNKGYIKGKSAYFWYPKIGYSLYPLLL